ncbi:hypothetical protein JG687_00018443, partial [Phytophthora cactorum]
RCIWTKVTATYITLQEVRTLNSRPPHLRYLAPAPTMEELQDLAGEASDKVHCSNIMGEKDQR